MTAKKTPASVPAILEAHRAAAGAEDARIEEAKLALSAAIANREKVAQEVLKAIHSDWADRGGCERCNGTGTALIWWTLDGGSYDEHGPCESCGATGGTAGPHPYASYVPRSTGGHRYDAIASATRLAPEKIAPLTAEVERLQEAMEATCSKLPTSRRPERRDVAIVVSGRKVAPGTIGVVLGYTAGTFGERVGLLLPTGSVLWLAAEHVQKIHPSALDETTRQDCMVAWIDNDRTYRAGRRMIPLAPETYAEICGLPK